MANYVANKIICTEEILNKYFIDYYPIDENEKLEKPYISFNKLFGVKSLNEYIKKYDVYIYYGYGFSYEKNKNGLIEIKFYTRWKYPIYAIIKSIEMFKEDLIWYACEENKMYISKFFWDGKKVQESILDLENKDYINWRMNNDDFIEENIECPDDEIWHYDYNNKNEWKIWNCNDLIKRYYKKYPAKEYYKEMKNEVLEHDTLYYYLSVKYEDSESEKAYNYISEDENIEVGDRVLVDRTGELTTAVVLDTGYFNEFNAPFPVNITKNIIKKIDNDFKIEEQENVLKLNIDDTEFEFGISNYISKEDNDENWAKIKLKVINKNFYYDENREIMTCSEIEELLEEVEKLLKDEIKEKSSIDFLEPDIEFCLYPKINLWDLGNYIYIKKGHEIQDIFIELSINLTDNNGVYTGQKYVMVFAREEIEKIVEYIKNVIKI